MKTICVEEHTVDPAIMKATAEAMMQEAPYFKGFGSTYADVPLDAETPLPALISDAGRQQALAESNERRIERMDQHGIDVQMLSYTAITQLLPDQSAPSLAAAANDKLARIVSEHPSRFAAFSTLPWQNEAAAVKEIERTKRDLKLPATMIMGRPGETEFLDHPRYDSILAALEAFDVPLYIHPGLPLPAVQVPYYGGFSDEVTSRFSLVGWGWHHEAGILVLRMMLAGVFDRFPKLKVISGHWGEMVPFYLHRMDDMLPQGVTGLKRTLTQTYRDQVWVTPSGMLYKEQFHFIREILGTEHILYAVDYPYLTMSGARAWLEDLSIPPQEREAVAHGNAEHLFALSGA